MCDSQKSKWKRQIRDGVHELHKEGIVWGDGKPSNIIIDNRGDAVLADFEGGTTKDWVDRCLYGTNEVDIQGLGRIEEWIDNNFI